MIGLMVFIKIIIMLLLSSLWGIVVTEEFIPLQQLKDMIGLGLKRKLYSKYMVIDYIIFLLWKVSGCPMCASYWIFSITYLCLFGSFIGFIFGVISYFLTFFIKNWMSIQI